MNNQRPLRPSGISRLLELLVALRRRRSSRDVERAACQGYRWQPNLRLRFAADIS